MDSILEVSNALLKSKHLSKEDKKRLKEATQEWKMQQKRERDRYKPKRFVAEHISVDSGCMIIVDRKWFEGKTGDRDLTRTDLWKEFDVERGSYHVDWKVPNSWNGNVKGEGRLKIYSGKMIVTDPCYLIGEEYWDTLLNETDYLRLPPLGIVVLDKHGGDGGFDVQIKLQRLP